MHDRKNRKLRSPNFKCVRRDADLTKMCVYYSWVK